MPAKKDNPNVSDQLEEILDILYQMNKRDRLRTMGGFFKGLISMIPIIVLLASLWYAYEYGDVLLEKVSESAARQAAKVTQQGSADIMDRIRELAQ